ncbi:MAG: hypothetical protein CL693_02320 [Cellvibrionaceae bacterium]|nr:hypothetical protein [Cellvibrionaceae bacterium]|tara:strand:- start:4383 stop:4769 length:387 start_codon:yes stop_codon:yes gene_type:complete
MQKVTDVIAVISTSLCRFCALLLITWVAPTWAQQETSNAEVQLRDPTRPLSYIEGAGANKPSGWRLDSVLISSQRKQAVINGKSVSEDSWIRGAQVKRIQANKVVILVKGEERVLRLRSGIRKTKVEG